MWEKNDFIRESQLHSHRNPRLLQIACTEIKEKEVEETDATHSKRPSDEVWDSKEMFWSPGGTSIRSGSVDFDILAHLLTRIWAWPHSEVFADRRHWMPRWRAQELIKLAWWVKTSLKWFSIIAAGWRISESGSNLVKAVVALKCGERHAYCRKQAHCDRCTGFATIRSAGNRSVCAVLNGESGCSSNGREEHVGQNLLHVQTSMQQDQNSPSRKSVLKLMSRTVHQWLITGILYISRCREKKKPLLHRKIIDLKSELAVKAVV